MFLQLCIHLGLSQYLNSKFKTFIWSGDEAYGRMGGWEDGRMGGWAYGRMGGWEDGRMGGWEDGRILSTVGSESSARMVGK